MKFYFLILLSGSFILFVISAESKNSSNRNRRQCNCVSQYTPVNCRCKSSGKQNAELLCRLLFF